MTQAVFEKVLELSVMNYDFLFDGALYQQVEGLGMGLPLRPSFANILLCFGETNCLIGCPSSFRPVFFEKYFDVHLY